jgi:hypothetical protein
VIEEGKAMRSHLIWCIGANIVATLLAVGVLYLYPPGSGFTFTSFTSGITRYVEGGPLIAALLMICVDGAIAVYLASRVYAEL